MEATYITPTELRKKFEALYPYVSLEYDDNMLEFFILMCKKGETVAKVASYLYDDLLSKGISEVQE